MSTEMIAKWIGVHFADKAESEREEREAEVVAMFAEMAQEMAVDFATNFVSKFARPPTIQFEPPVPVRKPAGRADVPQCTATTAAGKQCSRKSCGDGSGMCKAHSKKHAASASGPAPAAPPVAPVPKVPKGRKGRTVITEHNHAIGETSDSCAVCEMYGDIADPSIDDIRVEVAGDSIPIGREGMSDACSDTEVEDPDECDMMTECYDRDSDSDSDGEGSDYDDVMNMCFGDD